MTNKNNNWSNVRNRGGGGASLFVITMLILATVAGVVAWTFWMMKEDNNVQMYVPDANGTSASGRNRPPNPLPRHRPHRTHPGQTQPPLLH